MRAIVATLRDRYAFVVHQDRRLFVLPTDCEDFQSLEAHDVVEFDAIVEEPKGGRAIGVRLVKHQHGERAEGRITKIDHVRGFGFVAVDGDKPVFAHRSEAERPEIFEDLRVGDLVRGAVVQAAGGRRLLRFAKAA